MADIDERLKVMGAELRMARDELRVQMHLAKADARDEWDRLEGKWDEFEEKWDKIEDAAEDAGKDIGRALTALGQELKAGYEKIRDAM